MTADLERIKEAIVALPDEDRNALAAWLNVHSMDEWELEMKSDFSSGGRVENLVARVRDQIRDGKFTAMPTRDTAQK
jgi:hypothetical protein